MERAEIEKELMDLAMKLGGSWRFDQGVMPVIVLTLPEARVLAEKIDQE